jgi:hypothetical protein
MPVFLSFMAVGAFFVVAAMIEATIEGQSTSANTLKSNKRRKRSRERA